MVNMEVLGSRITEARERMELNKRGLSKLAVCSDTTVHHLEAGDKIPKSYTMANICWALKISADWALGLTDVNRAPDKKPSVEMPGKRMWSCLSGLNRSCTEASRGIGISVELFYQSWRNSTKAFSMQTVVKIARYYGVSVDYMLGLTDERRIP